MPSSKKNFCLLTHVHETTHSGMYYLDMVYSLLGIFIPQCKVCYLSNITGLNVKAYIICDSINKFIHLFFSVFSISAEFL
jgi:hypothetical protein